VRLARHRAPFLPVVLNGLVFPLPVVAGIALLAIGEMTQAPRYYEYIAELAPPGQQGMFQGYAFCPSPSQTFWGATWGLLYHHLGEVAHRPEIVPLCVFGVGMAATVLNADLQRGREPPGRTGRPRLRAFKLSR